VAEVENRNGIIGPSLQPEDERIMSLESGAVSFMKSFILTSILFTQADQYHRAEIDTNGVSYSSNAGGTDQHGTESFVSYSSLDEPGKLSAMSALDQSYLA